MDFVIAAENVIAGKMIIRRKIMYMNNSKKMAASSSENYAALASGRSKKSKCCPYNGINAHCNSCICCKSEYAALISNSNSVLAKQELHVETMRSCNSHQCSLPLPILVILSEYTTVTATTSRFTCQIAHW